MPGMINLDLIKSCFLFFLAWMPKMHPYILSCSNIREQSSMGILVYNSLFLSLIFSLVLWRCSWFWVQFQDWQRWLIYAHKSMSLCACLSACGTYVGDRMWQVLVSSFTSPSGARMIILNASHTQISNPDSLIEWELQRYRTMAIWEPCQAV